MEKYAKVKITDLMFKAYESCGEDSRCDECPAELGEDDCIFNQEISTLDGWIPVNERLPEENGIYIVTLDEEMCGHDTPFTDVSRFENGFWSEHFAIAWQPLPEPYKED